MGVMDSLKDFVGRFRREDDYYTHDDERHDDVELIDDYEFAEEPYRQRSERFSDTTKIQARSSKLRDREDETMVTLPGGASQKVVLVNPVSFDDVGDVGDMLKARSVVSVNLESVEFALGQRMIDYLHGVVDALEGDIQNSSNKTFIVAPSGIKITDLFKERLDTTGVTFARSSSKVRSVGR